METIFFLSPLPFFINRSQDLIQKDNHNFDLLNSWFLLCENFWLKKEIKHLPNGMKRKSCTFFLCLNWELCFLFPLLCRSTSKWHFQKSGGARPWDLCSCCAEVTGGKQKHILCCGPLSSSHSAARPAIAGLLGLHGSLYGKCVWSQINQDFETAVLLSRAKHSKKLLWRL